MNSDAADSILSLTTDSTTTLEVITGSLSPPHPNPRSAARLRACGRDFERGGRLDASRSVLVRPYGDRALSFASGDSVAVDGIPAASAVSPAGEIAVAANLSSTLNAIGTNFTTNGVGNLIVGAGGHLTAANSRFTLSELSLDTASVLNPGDLTGDIFDQAIAVPYNDVQYLADNISFQDIDINANGSVNSGTLALNSIGTNPANLRYVFPGNFAVSSSPH